MRNRKIFLKSQSSPVSARLSQGGQFIKLNKQGLEESIPVPATSSSVSLMFSENKIYAIVTDSGSDRRIEIYSRPL